eukprot:1088158-Amphidinium_carterae.1
MKCNGEAVAVFAFILIKLVYLFAESDRQAFLVGAKRQCTLNNEHVLTQMSQPMKNLLWKATLTDCF